jgi:hypothetical protein
MNHADMKPKPPDTAKPKISQSILAFAGDFIRLGKTPEQKQNYLNGACVAWNIASAPPERREKLVDEFLAEYKRHNPNTDEVALTAIRSDMEHLIEVKLKMFPGDLRQIVSARIFCSGNQDRIEVASARL